MKIQVVGPVWSNLQGRDTRLFNARGNAINRAPGFSSLQQPRRHVAEFWKFSCQAQATLLWAVFEEQPRMNNTSEESELLWWSRDNGRVDTQGLIQKSPNKGWVLVQQNFEDGTLVQPHSPISSGNIPTVCTLCGTIQFNERV